jgi:succinyl-CoA synthetase beta subunit
MESKEDGRTVLDGFRKFSSKVHSTEPADNCDCFLEVKEYVVKAQILAGGRGKGHFDNGFKGGVHLTKDKKEAIGLADKMLGHKLITNQTPADGIEVKKVMIADSVNIVRETYFCIILDREHNGPVLIASEAGGMDIEQVAKETPEKVKTIAIDPVKGLTHDTSLALSDFLGFKGKLREKAANEIEKLFELFEKVDAVQIEINPLAETDDGRVISVDAKLNFDDNAQFRQKRIFEMEDTSEIDPKEVEASKYNLNYISMEDGNIGCMVNGAGLAMYVSFYSLFLQYFYFMFNLQGPQWTSSNFTTAAQRISSMLVEA